MNIDPPVSFNLLGANDTMMLAFFTWYFVSDMAEEFSPFVDNSDWALEEIVRLSIFFEGRSENEFP